MNNERVNHMPQVPGEIPHWSFYTQLRCCRHDFGVLRSHKESHRLGRRTLLLQLHLMANTKCQSCSGYGHRARDCPTNMRLGMLGSANIEWGKLIAWTRVKVQADDRDRQAGLL